MPISARPMTSSCWANVHAGETTRAYTFPLRGVPGASSGAGARAGTRPSFFALRSAQVRVTMSGASAAGTRTANMPSVCIRVLSAATCAGSRRRRTAPTPARARVHLRGNVGTDESVDNERRGCHAGNKTTPLKGGNVCDDNGRKELQSSVEIQGSKVRRIVDICA